jgi:hypothetical protein
MTKDKQIEEMYKDVKCIHRCFLEDDDFDYLDEYIAVKLYKKGYRKSTDLAREIFEEIDNILRRDASDCDDLMDSETVPEIYTEYLACSNYIYGIRHEFAELKKKYTESEKEK